MTDHDPITEQKQIGAARANTLVIDFARRAGADERAYRALCLGAAERLLAAVEQIDAQPSREDPKGAHA